jgi:hypothetical protein
MENPVDEESTRMDVLLSDEEFVDVDALYEEVRTLQRANEQLQERANEDRERYFKKVRSLQKELERSTTLVEKLKRIEVAYYSAKAENAALKDLAVAVRAWSQGPAAEARQKLYQVLAVVDGAAGSTEES